MITVVLLIVVLILKIYYDNKRNISVRLASEIRQAVHKRQAQNKIQRLYDQNINVFENVTRIQKKLNHMQNQSDIVMQMAVLAKRNNIRISRQQYVERKNKYNTVFLDAEFEMHATYSDLKQYLVDLDALPFWVQVEHIDIQRTGKGRKIESNIKINVVKKLAADSKSE